MKRMLDLLQRLMCGLNYQTTFGIDIFDNCPDFESFIIQFKIKYPESKLERTSTSSITESAFWEGINYAFDYRGDQGSGLILNEKEANSLLGAQGEYENFIKIHLDKHTKLYSYNGEGIPGYPVFWEYYLIIESQNRFIFLYGSSSD